MNALIERLGMVEAERFVMLIRKDAFDYTKWRENLFDGLSLEELPWLERVLPRIPALSATSLKAPSP